MATFLVAHGAWSSAFAWRKMRPLMRSRGHELITPSYTGLGERAHLAHGGIDLDAHINDLLAVLHYEDLTELCLIGHSYGGMVATGVADRALERLKQIIYLDAFAPRDGQSLFDLIPAAARAEGERGAAGLLNGWGVPPNPLPPDTAPADAEWLAPRRQPQPVLTFSTPLRLTRGETTLPRSYIYCTRAGPGDVFAQFAAAARSDPCWRYFEMDASHNPHVTAPEELATLLDHIASMQR